jgi:ribosomal protein L39E
MPGWAIVATGGRVSDFGSSHPKKRKDWRRRRSAAIIRNEDSDQMLGQ